MKKLWDTIKGAVGLNSTPEAAASRPSDSPREIVLIEDNPDDVALVKMALDESGLKYRLHEFSSGAEAIRVLCSAGNTIQPDAVLVDLHTPASDGFETIAALRTHLGQIPITIFTSSNARSEKTRAAISNVEFLQKPVDLNEFLTSVGTAVQRMLTQTTA